jgi:hypothetical protein
MGDKEITTQSWKEQLEKLIRLVDLQCTKKRLTTRKLVGIIVMVAIYSAIFILLAYLSLNVGIGILSYALTLPSEQGSAFLAGQLASYAALTVGIAAILLSLMSPSSNLFSPSSSSELAEHYYNRLLKNPTVTTNDKAYLKVLVRMKCDEFDISLWEIYQNSIRLKSNLFSEESLLRSLYSK